VSCFVAIAGKSHLLCIFHLELRILTARWSLAVDVKYVVNAAQIVVAVILLLWRQDARLHGAKVR
jgi:hypothetical protein